MSTIPRGFVLDEESFEESETLPEGFQVDQEEKVPKREALIKSSEPIEEFGQQFGKGFGGEVASVPRSFAELLSYGSRFLAQKGEEQNEQKGEPLSDKEKKFTQKVLKGMDFPLKVLDKIGYPTKEGFEEMIDSYSQLTGQDVPSEAQTAAGRYGKTGGEFAAYAGPGKAALLPLRLGMAALGAAGSQGAEELGLGKGAQIGASIGLPIAAHLAKAIFTKKFTPSSTERKKLAEFFRKQGMNETEITTLLQPKLKIETLGKIAKSGETRGPLKTDVPEILKGIETKLGASYESLKEQAAVLPALQRKSLGNVLNEFDKVISGINKSRMPGTDKVAAKKIINESINDISARGLNAEEIIETWQDINKAVKPNSYANGKKDLARLKKPLKEALREIDPEIAKNFETLNEGWGKMKNIQEKLSPSKIKNFYTFGKLLAVGSGVVQGVAHGDWKILTGLLGTELTQRIATKMLTDPRYQNSFLKIASSVNQGSKVSGRKAMKEFVDQLIEDFPEETRDVEWEQIIGE